MSNQKFVYYTISIVMISIGLLMLSSVFSLSNGQLNLINIGASLVTLSTALVRLLIFKKIDIFFSVISKLSFVIGLIFVFTGFLLKNFESSLGIIILVERLDSNPLVLVCLGITISSIMLVIDSQKKKSFFDNKELQEKINTLETEKRELEYEIDKASVFLEKLKEKKDD